MFRKIQRMRTRMFNLIYSPDRNPVRYSFSKTVFIGRSRDSSLVISDPQVSGTHCRIDETSSGVVITDLNSKNGTCVNKIRINQKVLAPGDIITIGQTTLQFFPVSAPVVEQPQPSSGLKSGVIWAAIAVISMLAVIIISVAIYLNGVSRGGGGGGGGGGPYNPKSQANTATFNPGTDNLVAQSSIGPSGGNIIAGDASALQGVAVNFPAGALSIETNVSLSQNTGNVAPISGQASGIVFSLDTPNIDHFNKPVTVTIPFPGGDCIPIPYYIDDNGRFHVVDIVDINSQNNTMEFEIHHASMFTVIFEFISSVFGGGSGGGSGQGAGGGGGGATTTDSYFTAFLPEKDGFQIVNRGSEYNDGGECSGMCSFAMWYFLEAKSNEGDFYPRFMDIIGEDSSQKQLTGQNIIAARAYISINQHFSDYWPQIRQRKALTDQQNYVVIRDILLNTANPALIYLYHDQTQGSGAHCVMAYGYNSGDISIYDPNDPGVTQTIAYDQNNQSFNDYSNYDGIVYRGRPQYFTEPYENILRDANNNFSSSGQPVITIESHTNGQDVTTRNATITGTVASSQVKIEELKVLVGGIEYKTDIGNDGRYAIEIPLNQGVNHFTFTTSGRDNSGNLMVLSNNMEKIDFTLNGVFDTSVILVTLTWDTPDTDLDLYVVDPTGDYSFFSKKMTADGGELDIDDTDGFGPEHWTLATNDNIQWNQDYRVRVHYYDDNGRGSSNFKVDAVLYEGTSREYSFVPFSGNIQVSNSANSLHTSIGPDWVDVFTIRPVRDGSGSQLLTMSNAKMYPVNNSGVTADIDVNPNTGVSGTPATVTIKFTNGADLVAGIRASSFSEVNGWNYPMPEPAVVLIKQDSSTWVSIPGLCYTDDRKMVTRFYATKIDDTVVAIGDVLKNGGGPAVPWENEVNN
jgi:uncharacterized protein YfaP (DUF2135 family)